MFFITHCAFILPVLQNNHFSLNHFIHLRRINIHVPRIILSSQSANLTLNAKWVNDIIIASMVRVNITKTIKSSFRLFSQGHFQT